MRLRHWSNLAALLAVIMLVIAGTDRASASTPCNPCPPDCPKMAKVMAAAATDHHGGAPAKPGQVEHGCMGAYVCQASATVPNQIGSEAVLWFADETALLPIARPVSAPARLTRRCDLPSTSDA